MTPEAALATDVDGAPVGAPAARPHGPGGSIASVVLTTVVVLLAFVGLRLAHHDGDPTVFVAAGDEVTDPARAPDGLTVVAGSKGYDGQLFYRLARNPLTHGRTEGGIELVRPEYRHQRIGYPVLAWLTSAGGRTGLLPWTMIAVNVAAVAVVAGGLAAIARDAGRSVWWGLLAAGWSGWLVVVARDLSEAVAAAFLVSALLALRRRRWPAAAALLTAAALSRETSLLLPVALIATHGLALLPWRGWWRSATARPDGPPVWVGLVPIAAFGAWRLALRAWWASVGNAEEAPDSFLVAPLSGLVRQLRTSLGDLGDPATLLQLLQLLLVLGAVALLASALRDPGAGLPHERLALVAGIALLTLMPAWDRSITFLRWSADVVVIGTVVALSARAFDVRRLAGVVGTLWVLTAPLWIIIA